MEIDDDENSSQFDPVTCIKHVTFISKEPPYDVLKITQVSQKT